MTPLVSLAVLLVLVGMIAFTIGTLKYQPLPGTPAARGMETAEGPDMVFDDAEKHGRQARMKEIRLRFTEAVAMLVDATTLSDLEVFQDATGKGGLFGLLDETETRVGRAALRRRFERPHGDRSAIRRTQDAVGFFLGHPDVLPIPDGAIEDLRHYLDSNVVVSRPSGALSEAVAARWFAMRYREPYRELREGVLGTLALLKTSIECARRVLGLDPVLDEGLLGSIAMLLEPSGLGVTVDLDALHVPEGTPLEQWLVAFPSYVFVLLAPPDAVDECGRRAAGIRGTR